MIMTIWGLGLLTLIGIIMILSMSSIFWRIICNLPILGHFGNMLCMALICPMSLLMLLLRFKTQFNIWQMIFLLAVASPLIKLNHVLFAVRLAITFLVVRNCRIMIRLSKCIFAYGLLLIGSSSPLQSLMILTISVC